ncbi:MAG: myo-inositol-1(or 4)-monophosphatase [Planctomycetota bacterium]|jgi:myo-inositol-1(or 4)-monophosphatase
MNAQELEQIMMVAHTAAFEAGALLMDKLGRLDSGSIRSKSAARDLVTDADVASERLLVERLRTAFPGHAIEAEEEVCDAQDDRPRWFLDPLDGTVNYVHRLPAFCVSMGLFQAGQPLIAIVYAPVLRECFLARLGGGATCNGRPMQVSSASTLGESILATGFPYRRGEVEHSNLENFSSFFYDVRGMRRMGSAAIDLAYVADGRFDGYWELHLSPHDIAAGALLVREAGGVVTDASGGDDWLRQGHIVASGAGIHGAIQERLRH